MRSAAWRSCSPPSRQSARQVSNFSESRTAALTRARVSPRRPGRRADVRRTSSRHAGTIRTLTDRGDEMFSSDQAIERSCRVCGTTVQLGERHDQPFVQGGDRTPSGKVRRGMARIPVSSARIEERGFVREVAVEGRALYASALRNRGHRRLRWAERPMELDGAVGDAETSRLLGLRASLHPICALFSRHRCRVKSRHAGVGRVIFATTTLSDEIGGLMLSRPPAPRIVGPRDGKAGNLGSIGVRFMIDTEETHAGGFSLVEHPLPPRHLAAPLHRHNREDEYRFVLEGRMGALLGDDVVYAGPATSSTSRADSGTRSGMPATRPAESSRSSLRRASRSSSTSSWMRAGQWLPDRPRWRSSA